MSPQEAAYRAEIVSLALGGKTNSEIGKILFISPNTVRNHIHNVYKKAGTRNRVELTNLILEQESMPLQQG